MRDREYITKTIPMLTNDPAAFTRPTNGVQSTSLRGGRSQRRR